jgi:hypothetical protein
MLIYVLRWDGPLQTLRFLFRYEIQNGGYGRTCLSLDRLTIMYQDASSQKTNCPAMIIGSFSVFYADRKSKMAATTDPMNIHVQFGFNHICSFSEEGI